ncbi:unnamed protein product [Adineta steineri]|uniref:Uncharacterized protein n=1 Tax=Adineta steineri TaxID=433720 RepID=A0A813NMJ6_9BILA|nr:unnamed protein product [Adineta steineri]CAF4043723.1 unnamed protein product [Adineta steineri]
MYIPGSMINNHQQQTSFLNHHLLHELNTRYLHDINTNGNNNLSTFLRPEHIHNLNSLSTSNNNFSPFSRPNISTSSVLSTQTNPRFHLNPISMKKENFSSSIKNSKKWCSAHVRISWMIYQHQQHNSSDLIPKANHLASLFNYPSPLNHSNTIGCIPPSSNNAFGGLGTLFSPIPVQIDRKTTTTVNHDRSQFHRKIESHSKHNHNAPSKNINEINRKRSSIPLTSFKRSRSRSPQLPSSSNINSSIEQQYRLASTEQTNTYFPLISPRIATLMQHEYFLNSLRLSAANSNLNNSPLNMKNSISSNSSSSSKKAKYVKNKKESSISSNYDLISNSLL